MHIMIVKEYIKKEMSFYLCSSWILAYLFLAQGRTAGCITLPLCQVRLLFEHSPTLKMAWQVKGKLGHERDQDEAEAT